MIDYASDAETMGKGVGDDFRDGKMTLPVILAYARGGQTPTVSSGAPPCTASACPTTISPAPSRLLKSTDALSDTIERARQYARRAVDALGMFPASKAKSALTEAAEFAVARAY